jgi:hypothetical protein
MGEKQTMGGDNAGVVLHPTSQSLIYFLYPVRGGGRGGGVISRYFSGHLEPRLHAT